ncbi:MAG: HpaII family restriction endonuclease [Pusillimonas sp.]
MNGNIGEWSELYALFKLLADGIVYAADENVNKYPNIYFQIIKAQRFQNNKAWDYIREGTVTIIKSDEISEISIPVSEFADEADKILAGIKKYSGKGGAFNIPEVIDFIKKIKCSSIKASSNKKADVFLLLRDITTKFNETFGFSIKSQLGSPSTLLNASSATNFVYRIKNTKLTREQIDRFNDMDSFKEKFTFLNDLGAKLEFVKIPSENFDFNLSMISSDLPLIWAKMIELSYLSKDRAVASLAKKTADSGIVNTLNNQRFIEYKIKNSLVSIALGMMPGTLWNGLYEALGGYIIVKKDGEIVCYHIFNQNAFRDYVFLYTKLDTPATKRNNFGTIYEENGEHLIKLNLQIRFTK